MYYSYYGLKSAPFAVVPDPTFIYWAKPHSMAFAMLQYGIANHAGFTVITGEIGAGKTTLIRQLLGKLPVHMNVALLSNVQGGRGELLQWVLMAFDQEYEDQSYVSLYKRFETFLSKAHHEGKRNVLIIDEAQNLGTDTLEELRMLSNINTHEQELLQIILSGQPELKQLLSAPELTQFVQRISSDFHLALLEHGDVSHYIDHRLKTAGANRRLFADDAYHLISSATRGTPRLINILCDTSLMYGYAMEEPIITADIVQQVLNDKRQYGVFPLPSAVKPL
ncbi:ExeA family protein [Mesorhizobium koreense]|uniref:ExeA family protein n=1 Tax=Mesorhizobium koreense TaxID=3074855 RepID=UPI00287B9FE7|nr:AAA family ATPase [Mesorhizobium sp. WR6]